MYDLAKFNPKKSKFVVYSLSHFTNPSIKTQTHDSTVAELTNTINEFNRKGINVLILSFIYYSKDEKSNNGIVLDGDSISDWCNILTPIDRQNIKKLFNGVIMVSHGGAAGTTNIVNYPTKPNNGPGNDVVAEATWNFVKKYDLDGVDVDYENINSHNPTYPDKYYRSGFTTALSKIKPQLTLLTMAPQMVDGEWSNCHDLYVSLKNIDWFNMQYYNQPLIYNTYDFAIMDSTSSDTYQISLNEVLTGRKKHRDNKLTNNYHCLYNEGKKITDCLNVEPIPPYALAFGSCTSSPPDGCSDSQTPTNAYNLLHEAATTTDPCFDKSFFTNGGGYMVWDWGAMLGINNKYNQEILTVVSNLQKLFTNTGENYTIPDPLKCFGPDPGMGPTPTSGPLPPDPTKGPIPPDPTKGPIPPDPTKGPIPPDPTKGPIPPDPTKGPIPPDPTKGPIPPGPGKCKNINCNKYGVCNPLTGMCECGYGYSGKNCEIMPKCIDYVKNPSKTLLVIGIVLTCISVAASTFFFYRQMLSVFIGVIIVIVFITGLFLIVKYNSFENKHECGPKQIWEEDMCVECT